ncbi:Probable bifunctional protein acetyl-/propionyl-coenzyme A carboxylase (epsilon chain) AccE5 [Mycobacteroides abscessus subsp. abscessus]|nr:Probable bifunctional protein acetyl-/propionyl-coenzyme A carboxylase (epsilon chain) AccE5 [Mycobacteroides abscessus subsp. abscessus]
MTSRLTWPPANRYRWPEPSRSTAWEAGSSTATDEEIAALVAALSALASTAEAADIQVLSGNPTDEEIAALVAALSALASTAEAADLKPRNLWAEPIDMLRYSPHSWQRVTLFERAKLARPRGTY